MSTNDGVDGGRVLDQDQTAGVQGVDQWAPRAVLGTMDQRFWRFEQCFDDLIVMGHNTNRYRNIDRRRLGAGDAYGYPINRPVTADYGLQMYDDDFEKEGSMSFEEQQPHRRGYGGSGYRRNYHGYDQRDCSGGRRRNYYDHNL